MDNISCVEISKHLGVDYDGCNAVFTSISTDTRSLKAGALFIALKGENFDGHDYIEQAIKLGAAGLLVSKEIFANVPVIKVTDTLWAYGQIAALHRSKFKIPMIAITGSCGKTTVKEMITNILRLSAKVLSPTGNFNNEIGLPKTLLELSSEHEYAVLEMGARNKGDIKYLMELVKPQVSIITCAAPVHIETFGNLDGVAAAKGEIYQFLQPHGTAVVNVDDQYAAYWLNMLKTQNVIRFGLECAADITCAYIVEEENQLKFELVTDLGMTEIILPLLGLHNVKNAIAAAALARALDISLEDIKQGLESFRPVTRRMEIKCGKKGSKIIDDSYNANPLAMEFAIEVLAKQLGTKILVVGDMLELGDEAEIKHKILGQKAKEMGIDYLFGFGNLAQLAIAEFGANAAFFSEKKQLITRVLSMLNDETVVLVKGSNGMGLNEVVCALQLPS